jgi:superfamily II DNA or RNA helicase
MVSNNPLKILAAVNLIKSIKYEKAIVFFTTTAAVDYFYDIMVKEGVSVSKIHSKMKKDERRSQYKDFENDTAKVLVGAFAIGEGLNLPSSDTAIIVGGTSKEREFVQRVGRVVRTAAGKGKANIYQIFAIRTNEEKWVKSRTLNVAKSTVIETREI